MGNNPRIKCANEGDSFRIGSAVQICSYDSDSDVFLVQPANASVIGQQASGLVMGRTITSTIVGLLSLPGDVIEDAITDDFDYGKSLYVSATPGGLDGSPPVPGAFVQFMGVVLKMGSGSGGGSILAALGAPIPAV